jgi:hypothetical protein
MICPFRKLQEEVQARPVTHRTMKIADPLYVLEHRFILDTDLGRFQSVFHVADPALTGDDVSCPDWRRESNERLVRNHYIIAKAASYNGEK